MKPYLPQKTNAKCLGSVLIIGEKRVTNIIKKANSKLVFLYKLLMHVCLGAIWYFKTTETETIKVIQNKMVCFIYM